MKKDLVSRAPHKLPAPGAQDRLMFATPHLTLLLCDMPGDSSQGVFLDSVPIGGQLVVTIQLTWQQAPSMYPQVSYEMPSHCNFLLAVSINVRCHMRRS